MSRFTIGLIALLVVLFVLADASLFTVDQTEQVLVTQFGEIVRPIRDPGLKSKLPFVQSIITFDKRLLSVELPDEEVILGDQRRLIVDSFAVYRITDPLKYYQAVGPGQFAIQGRLNSIVTASLRRVLGNNQLLDVLSADRERIMASIRDQVNAEMPEFGVSIEDVRIRRADLPPENTQAILQRMQSERQRVAARRAPRERRHRSASAPTPNAIGRCCWPRLAPLPTICAARARGRLSGFPPRPTRRMPTSIPSGVLCRRIGIHSSQAHLAWCLPRTTIFCAIFSRHRRREGTSCQPPHAGPYAANPPGNFRPCV